MRNGTSIALVALSLPLLACGPGPQSTPAPTADTFFTSLAPGVYAALQPDDKRFDESNVVVVIGRDAVLVVDAPSDEAFVRRVCSEIRKRTDKPVRYVVNTHWHTDHTQGNAVYRRELGPQVAFVGHQTLVADVPERAEKQVRDRVTRLRERIPQAEAQLASGKDDDGTEITPEERAKQLQAIARAKDWLERNRDVEFVAPTEPYAEESTTLSLGDRTVVLRHVRAHTRGDTLVFLPQEKLLMTGDVLDILPYVGHGYPREWVAALRDFAALDFVAIVPGHGPIFRDRKPLERELGYLEDLVAQVGKAAVAGRSLEETRAAVDLSAWRTTLAGDDVAAQRFFDGVLDSAIERAYAEAKGTAD
jgi:glyoxylase-like metal-dependent hydrolase (beta-lactamase superfamily II)